ncbi:4'-phosphopantetheinyl transferase family protein [Nonlabens marinus]|uniref:Siderophore (Surfactin) biosynthesis regulatory protein n=1 Tax=Nonlabens marinus S1-08 TaxID=1454201 RepID=W8VNX6_9FLAO|nr:4'-phosphopantetheinyl transferase superfamily protein [Nonlabens marinus]BAO54689.1 siderophore (Surfactin) biosynthesis regulatory protein [Nonlabens marinus S1-08]
MPVIKTLTNRSNTRVYVWEITESEAWLRSGIELSQNSVERLITMSSEVHRRGFLSIRHLLLQAGYSDKQLYYDELGKPHLEGEKYISITHSFELTAIIISDSPTGIDIEKRRDKIQRIAVKFVNYELQFIAQKTNKVSLLTVIWGAKESMYKCLGQKGLGFFEHCKVEPFSMESGETVSRIDFGEIQKSFDTYFQEILDYTLVYILPKS